MSFTKNPKLLKKKVFLFIFSTLIFSCYFCSIHLKSQSEQSWLCPDTSGPVLLLVLFSVQITNHLPEGRRITQAKYENGRTLSDTLIN